MRGFYAFGDLEPGTFFWANEKQWVKLPTFESDGKTLNALIAADVPAPSINSIIRTSYFGANVKVLADPQSPKASWLTKDET